ncbi:hypothetical protein EMIT0158MI4_80102 [Burkholderia ambifaria]
MDSTTVGAFARATFDDSCLDGDARTASWCVALFLLAAGCHRHTSREAFGYEQERGLRALVEQCPDPIVRYDRQGAPCLHKRGTCTCDGRVGRAANAGRRLFRELPSEPGCPATALPPTA